MDNKLPNIAHGLRIDILKMYHIAGWGHLSSALSCVDILVVLYYGGIFNLESRFQVDHDRVVLSKGHACAAWYAILAKLGYFPRSELASFYQKGSRLFGLASSEVPGIDISTGSLGQGICFATGTALAAKRDHSGCRTFVILGDGESQEGSVYEAAMFASNQHLDNLTVILDYNGLQGSGKVEDIASIEPIQGKWLSFGWNVIMTDGHDYKALKEAMDSAVREKKKPTIIIAKTVKGKGISFIENKENWHSRKPTLAEWRLACKEMNITFEELLSI